MTPEVYPKDRPQDLKDMKWLPDEPLHQWNPSVVDAIDFIEEAGETYNFFDEPADLFFKYLLQRPELGSRVIGVLPCPRGAGHCIDGYPDEVRVTSIMTITGHGKDALATCQYCGGVHTPAEVRTRLNAILPPA